MSHKQTDKQSIRDKTSSPGMEFFREESVELLGLGSDKRAPQIGLTLGATGDLPVLPDVEPAGEQEQKAYWRVLRNFFRTGKGGGIIDADRQPLAYPALLAPYRSPALRPGPYPIWLASADAPASGKDVRFRSVSDLIRDGIHAFAPQEGGARILKDNVSRLDRIIQRKVAFAEASYDAFPVLEEALADLVAELNISGTEAETLAQDIKRLKAALPRAGVIVPAGAQAPLHLLTAFLDGERKMEKAALRAEVDQLINRLNDLLAVEKQKSPEAHSSGQLQDALDFADSFLNFDELSSVLPASTSDAMPEERRRRIEVILDSLQTAGEAIWSRPAHLLVTPKLADAGWLSDFPQAGVHKARPEQLCRQAMQLFDTRTADYARVFAAIRLARLELDGHYRAELHGDFFAHFDWRSFSREEWLVCPPIFLVTEEGDLMPREWNDLSQLLASNRPVRIFVLKRTVRPENGESGEALSDNLMNRQELGALAIAHRNVCVVQTAMVDPVFFLDGLTEGLAVFSPVLFHVYAPDDAPENYFLYTGAAVESRGFPSLLYNTDRGPRWGSRFDIGANPQVEEDWPVHDLALRDAGGQTRHWQIHLTFADSAAQDAAFSGFFHIVPPEYWQEDLVLLSEYLELPAGLQFKKVPFIWLLDREGMLQKAAVAWPLVLFCRDRLDYWRYLQENAGIHSYHVEKATEQLRKEIEEKFVREVEALRETHRKEVEKTADEAARGAMEKLAAILLDMDMDVDLVGFVSAPAEVKKPAPKIEKTIDKKVTPKKETVEVKEAVQAEKPAETEEEPLGEAWIDTPLCTSCNECIELNKNIFQYDANKQAYVANPKGGPFADIVKAAENCPVRIIHPGAPQDPGEPGLEALIERAKPYN